MANILVPVQMDQDVSWTVNHLKTLHEADRIRVHLLSIQPMYTGLVRFFFSKQDLDNFCKEDALQELLPMKTALDKLNIPYNCHIRVGSKAQEIVSFAKDIHCPQIVIGPATGGKMERALFGTLNRRVASLIEMTGRRCEVL